MDEPVEILPYDPAWPAAFAAERDRIAARLGNLAVRIDHNGSTSVPGLAAKPIIDIQVSVRRLQPIAVTAVALMELGYVHVPHADDAFAPFFHRPAGWPHSHHVHVVQAGSPEERRTLAFRDYLRQHSGVAREYEQLKHRLALRFNAASSGSHQSYADAKTAFVARITERAFSAGLPRDL
jgi:GrpB-like predicted nucleotidyltransferase (UPF0157 family)